MVAYARKRDDFGSETISVSCLQVFISLIKILCTVHLVCKVRSQNGDKFRPMNALL